MRPSARVAAVTAALVGGALVVASLTDSSTPDVSETTVGVLCVRPIDGARPAVASSDDRSTFGPVGVAQDPRCDALAARASDDLVPVTHAESPEAAGGVVVTGVVREGASSACFFLETEDGVVSVAWPAGTAAVLDPPALRVPDAGRVLVGATVHLSGRYLPGGGDSCAPDAVSSFLAGSVSLSDPTSDAPTPTR